jgi:hypothetical protein
MDYDDQPEILDTPSGCLAVSARDVPFHVGVFGRDAEDARARFADALAAWKRIATLPNEEPHAIEIAA